MKWAAALESLSPWLPSYPFTSGSTRSITPSVVCCMTKPLHVPPPVSCASTPSNLGLSFPPACIGPPQCAPPCSSPDSTLADLPPPSGPPQCAPPCGSPASTLANLPPSTAPSSTIGCHPSSPHCIALKSSQKDPKPPLTVAKVSTDIN